MLKHLYARSGVGLLVMVVAAGLAGCAEPDPVDAEPDVRPIRDLGDTPSAIPPVTGGTMTATHDGLLAVAHPSQGGIYLIDVERDEVLATVPLGDRAGEPGRMVADPSGRLHVLQRQRGHLLTLDLRPTDDGTLAVLDDRAVCAAPRGLAHDEASDHVLVACAEGLLVSLPAAGGPATRSVFVDTDLRDVLVDDGLVYVSRFHTAELLVLDQEGRLLRREAPIGLDRTRRDSRGDNEEISHSPGVAYRIALVPGVGVAMLHQMMLDTPIEIPDSTLDAQVEAIAARRAPRPGASSYGTPQVDTRQSPCGEIVETALTLFGPSGAREKTVAVAEGLLHVDLAVRAESGETSLVLASASSPGANSVSSPRSVEVPLAALTHGEEGACVESESFATAGVSAVHAFSDGRLAFLLRDARTVWVAPPGQLHPSAAHRLSLSGDRAIDAGFIRFHASSEAAVACASCHPEGGEDGHTWAFDPLGQRRTQTLLIPTISETAPFHWSGDASSMETIMVGALVLRMGEPAPEGTVVAVERWVDSLRAPPPVVEDEAAVQRGAAVFHAAETACADCHRGPRLTNNETHDVGTGGAFQVPSLIGVAYRAPFFHDGCAPTLDAVIDGSCAGGGRATHGATEQLDNEQRTDLLAYLRTL